MLPVVDSVLPYHVSNISVLSKYQALEATPTPTSTSPPLIDSDMATKFNLTVNKESKPPNPIFNKSEAAGDADLDFEYDRMTIVASWRAHANLLMLFVRPGPVQIPVEKFRKHPSHANHMFFLNSRMAEWPALGAHRHTPFTGVLGGSASPTGRLGRLPRARFPAHGKRGCWRTWNASPIAIAIAIAITTSIDVAHPRSPRRGVVVDLTRVNASAVADELGGRSRLYDGRILIKGKGVPGLAHDTILALPLL